MVEASKALIMVDSDMKNYSCLLSVLIAVGTLAADIPTELKEHITKAYDSSTAAELLTILEKAQPSASIDAKKDSVQKILQKQDEALTAWLLSQPLIGELAIEELKKARPTATNIRAVCIAIRQTAPPDGAGVLHGGDVDDPGLRIWHLKDLFDKLLGVKTAPLRKSPDGQYHASQVKAWLGQANANVQTSPQVSAEIKAAVDSATR
jgi:hypothetical protein